MSRPMSIALLATIAAILLGIGPTAQASAKSAKRCGYVFDGPAKSGVYITHGRISCAKAKHIIRYTGTCQCGELLPGAGSVEKYPNGYTCGGHMGYYYCSKGGTAAKPKIEITWLECRDPGCPATTRVY
jgi:hypothetical protein